MLGCGPHRPVRVHGFWRVCVSECLFFSVFVFACASVRLQLRSTKGNPHLYELVGVRQSRTEIFSPVPLAAVRPVAPKVVSAFLCCPRASLDAPDNGSDHWTTLLLEQSLDHGPVSARWWCFAETQRLVSQQLDLPSVVHPLRNASVSFPTPRRGTFVHTPAGSPCPYSWVDVAVTADSASVLEVREWRDGALAKVLGRVSGIQCLTTLEWWGMCFGFIACLLCMNMCMCMCVSVGCMFTCLNVFVCVCMNACMYERVFVCCMFISA